MSFRHSPPGCRNTSPTLLPNASANNPFAATSTEYTSATVLTCKLGFAKVFGSAAGDSG